jgi:hypothetical protein
MKDKVNIKVRNKHFFHKKRKKLSFGLSSFNFSNNPILKSETKIKKQQKKKKANQINSLTPQS